MISTHLDQEQIEQIKDVLIEVLEDNGNEIHEALKALSRGVSVQFASPVISSFRECAIGPDRIYIHCLNRRGDGTPANETFSPTKQTLYLTFGLDMEDAERFAVTEVNGQIVGISFCTAPNIYRYFGIEEVRSRKAAI